jgi:signal transduction histidine kinase
LTNKIPSTGFDALLPKEPHRAARADSSSATYELHTSIAVLCLELAHELAPTLTCLRNMLRVNVFDGLDRSIVEEEILRLQEVIASLRRTKCLEEQLRPVRLARLTFCAAARARADIGGVLHLVVNIPEETVVTSNERAMELLLTALIRNALAAAATSVVISAHSSIEGCRLEVEDDGEGVTEGLEERLFRPLAMLGVGGRGTGMMVAARIALRHGWPLEYGRRDGHTVITLRFGAIDEDPNRR